MGEPDRLQGWLRVTKSDKKGDPSVQSTKYLFKKARSAFLFYKFRGK
tara:strand:- start:589 stop:729 length:141 start_codon:yes stop_codon:yes gene_type:complete